MGKWALWAGSPLLQRAVARPVASSLKRGLGGAAVWAVNLGALRRGARAPFLFALFPEYDCGNSILLVLPDQADY